MATEPNKKKKRLKKLRSVSLSGERLIKSNKKVKKSKTPLPKSSSAKKKTKAKRRRTASDASSKPELSAIVKLANSKTAGFLSKATKDLSFTVKNTKKEINKDFEEFNRALNDQQSKLLDDLQTIYDAKREQIVSIEQKIFNNAKKSKNLKQKEYDINTNITFIVDKIDILSQIVKYGSIQTENPEIKTDIDTKTNHTHNATVIIYDDLKSGDEADDKENDNDDHDAIITDTMAMRQKLILGEIQGKTMDKLDIVILMEKEAKNRSKQATKLRHEVDDGLKYIAERTKIINEKIAIATPNLEKAREVASAIDPKDINEIKTLKSPPIVIENVITATVMILGHNIREWKDVQRLLSYKFKPELLNFDTYTLSKATRQKVYKKYAGKEDFTYERVCEGSKVCGNLVLWVHSQIKYSRMLDVILPLEKEVKKLRKESKKKQKLAKELMKLVKELEANIKLYTDQCNQMIDHIIKSTDYELQQFSDKLQPLNDKFNQLLNKKL